VYKYCTGVLLVKYKYLLVRTVRSTVLLIVVLLKYTLIAAVETERTSSTNSTEVPALGFVRRHSRHLSIFSVVRSTLTTRVLVQ
jgi:hypothetical protein